MEEHGIKVIMFDRELQKQIEDDNKAFLKQAVHRAKKAQTEAK